MIQTENKFVVGFLFSQDRQYVVLIKKTHPPEQAGKLNGVGGRIEELESPADAMRREFMQEDDIDPDNLWEIFFSLSAPGWNVKFFRAFWDTYASVRSRTEEVVKIYPVDELDRLNVMPDLRWLIPMALQTDRKFLGSGAIWEEGI